MAFEDAASADEYFPAAQLVHAVDEAAPDMDEYVSTLQLRHVEEDVAAIAVEYLPAGQRVQAVNFFDSPYVLLRNRLIDLVNLNCMKIPTVSCNVECLMCDTIEDFIKYEQHSLNIISQVTSKDTKSENKYYGNVIVLNRMYTTNMY